MKKNIKNDNNLRVQQMGGNRCRLESLGVEEGRTYNMKEAPM
jgi:hypothetical protein